MKKTIIRFLLPDMQHKTIFEIIKQKREKLGFSCKEIAENLKIPARYIYYLENSELDKMPDLIYTQGFLGKYSEILGLDKSRILKLYEYELSGWQEKISDKKPISSSFKRSRPVISTRMIAMAVTSIVIAAVGIYWWKQIRLFFVKPSLQVVSPVGDLTVNQGFIEVQGKTNNGNEVTINNQGILVSDNGTFKKQVSLESGLNVLTITANNSFGKDNAIVRKIFFSPADKENNKIQADREGPPIKLTAESKSVMMDNLLASSFDLKIKTKTQASWISVMVGDDDLYSGVILPGIEKSFHINGQAIIRAGQAGGLLISVDGGEFKVVGEKNGTFKEVIVNKNGVSDI